MLQTWATRVCVSLAGLMLCSAAAAASDGIVILPSDILLTGPEGRQTLLVEKLEDGRFAGQHSEGVSFTVSDPRVVRVEDGVAIPTGNGKATITATVNGQSATATVTVQRFDQPHVWSFRNHVQSVLAKTGCSSGACHGAAAGKNGFKLSLRGYDPQADYEMLTRQSRGRRIVPSEPGRSLLLTKPTGAVPHKGGIRFRPDSLEYRVLAEWIAAGQPGPREDDPRLERLEILPDHCVLAPGLKQQLVVRAHFTDGHVEDVTRWAKYTSTNLSVADVDDQGRVTVMGHGEGAIVAWYLSRNLVASVSVPFDNEVPAEVYANAPRNNFIDDLVLEKLAALKIPPSPEATDGEFLRRAYLDTIGVLPTPEEVRRFLADSSPDKRERLADELLSRPEFVDYWSYKWSDLLLVSGDRLRPKAVEAYYRWIRTHVEQNTPWDEFAQQLVTAKGSTFENGAANFYSLHQDPLDMAETVSMAFLGLSINCARCHDHPLEKWTNDDYYGFASLFARVRGKGWGGDYRQGDGLRVIFTVDRGELIQPRTGQPQPPRPLDGQPLAFDDPRDRRIALAEWLTAPDNPYFSRAIANRIWANFMGVGVVEKVDDLRFTNPPSNEKLLAAMARYLAENDYDLKVLMRAILTSKTYQRSSRTVPGNEADTRFYSHFYPRRLKAEVLLDAICQVTGVPTKFPGRPVGTRALELPDASIASYFLDTFGRPDRLITCECERSDEPSMVQVLHIVNGETINQKLAAKGNRLDALLKKGLDDGAIVEEAYLTALARFPTEKERRQILEVFQSTPPEQKRQLLEDFFWSLLSSREFLFNH